MKQVKGNLVSMALNGDFDIIIHGCNCQCRMRNGIAKEIAERIPEAVEADNKTLTGCKDKLGGYSSALVYREPGKGAFMVINGYTQQYWGTESRKVDYKALRSVFHKVAEELRLEGRTEARIGYPRIGAGLAGGDWEIISQIIDEELEGLDHTYVMFEGSK